MIAFYVGENPSYEKQLLSGELDVELTPHGTLAETLRAGGARIPPGFLLRYRRHPTPIAEGKEERVIGGRRYILETSLNGDFAIVKAWNADW
jgi:3-oxoacid CoA-transferase subunit A